MGRAGNLEAFKNSVPLGGGGEAGAEEEISQGAAEAGGRHPPHDPPPSPANPPDTILSANRAVIGFVLVISKAIIFHIYCAK